MLTSLLSTEQTNYLCFVQLKIKRNWNQKANVVSIIQCPDCHNDNVGKTEKNIINRLSGHEKKKDQLLKDKRKKNQLFIDWQTFSQILGDFITRNMFSEQCY